MNSSRDIVILAGSAVHSVLSLCKMALSIKVRSYVVCIDDGIDYYSISKLVDEAYSINKSSLSEFWQTFFSSHCFEAKPILYPTTDATCLIVDDNRPFYEDLFELCLPSHSIVVNYNDKTIAENAASQNGLTVPKTHIVGRAEDFDFIKRSFLFPVIIKPQGAIYEKKVGFKFRIVDKPEDFAELIDIISQGCQLVVQEYIPGGDEQYSFYLFYRGRSGFIHDCMGVKSLQYNGIMAVGTVKYDEELAAICKEFLNRIDYVGLGGIEFKRYNGKYYFIEMSTRTEGFLAIALMSKSSLIEASYNDKSDIKEIMAKAKERVVYVDTFFWMLRRFHDRAYGKWLKELIMFSLSKHYHFAGLFLDGKFSLYRYWRIITNKL